LENQKWVGKSPNNRLRGAREREREGEGESNAQSVQLLCLPCDNVLYLDYKLTPVGPSQAKEAGQAKASANGEPLTLEVPRSYMCITMYFFLCRFPSPAGLGMHKVSNHVYADC